MTLDSRMHASVIVPPRRKTTPKLKRQWHERRITSTRSKWWDLDSPVCGITVFVI